MLADGDEVALIPPVSGGDFRLSGEPLSLDAAVREVRSDEAGAIATFTGTVRNRSRDRDVQYLEYEAYEGMAEEMMAELAAELSARHELSRDRDPPSRRPGRDRRAERRDRRLVAAPRRRARGLQGRDRHAQGDRAALEEGGLRGRRGVDRPRVIVSGAFREYPEPRELRPIRAARGRGAADGYSPIKQPLTTLRDILRKLVGSDRGARLPLLEAQVRGARRSSSSSSSRSPARCSISIAAYALFWGWQFAVGFVVLLLVHELGHVLEAKRQGLPVSAPMFIPFLGALIMLKGCPTTPGRRRRSRSPARSSAGSALRPSGASASARLRAARRARLHGLLPQPLQPRPDLAARRRPDRRRRSIRRSGSSGSSLCSGLAIVAPNPILILILDPRRPRVVAALAAPRRPRRRGLLPRHARAALDHRDLVHRPGGAAHARDERHVRRARPLTGMSATDDRAHPRADARRAGGRRRR